MSNNATRKWLMDRQHINQETTIMRQRIYNHKDNDDEDNNNTTRNTDTHNSQYQDQRAAVSIIQTITTHEGAMMPLPFPNNSK